MWTTASTPSRAGGKEPGESSSPSTRSKATPVSCSAVRSDVFRTSTRIRWPSAARARAVAGPQKPVAPVSSTSKRSDLRLVHAVRLVLAPAHHLDGAVDEHVVLERPGDLATAIAEAARGPQGVEVEDGVDAALP